MAGHPIDALRIAAGIRPAASTMSILRVELGLAEALARLEIGDRPRARTELESIAHAKDDPRLFAPVAAMLALGGMAADDDDPMGATRELERAERLVRESGGGPDLWQWVHRFGVVAAIAAGDPGEALRQAAAVTDTFWGPVSRARVGLFVGDRDAAVSALAVAVPRCHRHHVVQGLLRARTESIPDEVLRHVAPAVALASEHGMLRTVVSEGRALMDVIELTAWSVPEEWLHRLRLAMTPSSLATPCHATCPRC